MKVEFVQSIHRIMENNPKTVFLTGDLGFNAFEDLMRDFPRRIINVGAAEQNMIGVAAGLAIEGFEVWAYSIAPFATYRCLEQIRNDVCLHNLPVHVVGNGGGYSYGVMGTSHHTLEDMAVLKALPNMTIYCPCSNNHVNAVMEQIANLHGPSYLRLGYSGFPSNQKPLSENPQTLTRCYSEGRDILVIGVGQGVQVALTAMEQMSMERVGIWGVAKFPFDWNLDQKLFEHARKAKRVIVVEEHYIPGSLAESLKMQLPAIADFQVLAPSYSRAHTYGKPKFQLEQAGVTPNHLCEMINRGT